MLVYRDTKVSLPAAELVRDISAQLESWPLQLATVLRAGSLECALADVDAPSAGLARQLTDAIADAWLGEARALPRARELSTRLDVPKTLRFTRPEGFAFYALDPRSFVSLARDYATSVREPCAIFGVRSIGTTLSAIVRAELVRRGLRCERRTVRPMGHPFDRVLTWSGDDEQFLADFDANSRYVVVDEGPGLSGSTLLAVTEALARRGIPDSRIEIFCSHAPDPSALVAPSAAKRWARFVSHPAPGVDLPESALDLSGGRWRAGIFESPSSWPASWVEQERVKYLTSDRKLLVKFEGFPPYDEEPFARAQCLADAGWGPKVARAEPGFLAFEWLDGRPATRTLDRELATRLAARYLTFRIEAFPAAETDSSSLETMTRVNVQESLGFDLPADFELEVRTPVHADGHLMPHEWIVARERALKTDAVDHGNDHLFPGPTDVAWDLAGAVVEWGLDAAETEAMLRDFARLSGDDVTARLPRYIIAYSSFRIGVATFAGRNSEESARWRAARLAYGDCVRRALSHGGA